MIHRQLKEYLFEHLALDKGRPPLHSSFEIAPLAISSIFALGAQPNLDAFPIAGTFYFRIKECNPRQHLTGSHH